MIKYNLICANKHEFESWFSNSKEFDKLKNKKLLECIYCSNKKIDKSIMSPKVLNSSKAELDSKSLDDFKKIKKDLINLRKFVESNFEYVEKNFPEKVREIYYDKNDKKNIFGKTTEKEREELAEEGIDLISIPWLNKEN